VAVVTIQMDKSIVGYGDAGTVLTLTQTAQTDALIVNGEAHVYSGGYTPGPYAGPVLTVNGARPDGSGDVAVTVGGPLTLVDGGGP